MLLRLFLLFTLTCYTQLGQTTPIVKTDQPVWAFGDTHGAYGEFEKLLKSVNLVDKDLNWIGGRAHLVSTGDVLDRGPHPRKIFDLMMRLEKQAEEAGGGFHLVLGNHEVMILIGDLRYVSAAEYREFAADETPALREKYFQQYLAFHQRTNGNAEKLPLVPVDPEALKLTFDQQHPAGFFARYEAFLPNGKYGQWLLQKSVVLQVNDNLFAHGGLSPVLAGKNLIALNEELKSALNSYLSDWHRLIDANQLPVASIFRQRHKLVKGLTGEALDKFSGHFESLIFNYQSPTWYRGATYCHPYYEQSSIERLLTQFNAKRLFVGHTVTDSSRIEQRLAGKVTVMDTGMLKMVYGGQGNIVKIEKDQVKIFNSDGQSYDAKLAPHQSIRYPTNLSKAQLKDALKNAPISKIEKLNTGITEPLRLTFDVPDTKLRAVFKNIDTNPRMERSNTSEKIVDLPDRYHFDIAAYELSEFLGFRMVPMSVEREVNKVKGVVQYWVEDSYSEYTANEKGWQYRGYCSYDEQMNLMRIFDLLIYNSDRNPTNVLIEQNQEQLVWIDHSRAFSQHRRLPRNIDKSNIHLTPQIRQALQSLTRKKLDILMDGLLNRAQIRAILKRRDYILKLDPKN